MLLVAFRRQGDRQRQDLAHSPNFRIALAPALPG
jgi:hypothetical protein